ncbi:hypothetical protein [Rariglobus hedericola]|uniref:Periplasmic heavy metal sensor n=1 Tax=Rariglobus hedericola TaxID=2597822 RepID=A0A556QL43_9BACT|nr:hypothetical protein [Rariglobus hedericola]TSJ77358.1 hypothetical protein FPL22_14800 [Rariglobus hedericola]
MSPLARYSLIAVAAAVLAFGITHFALRHPATAPTELAWMQKEFHLTAAQTAVIEKIHTDYQPVCADHCARIIKAREQLASAADPAAARVELARLEAVCQQATQTHLQRVADVMSPADAARFLALVGPKLSNQNHSAPLGLK